MIIGVVLAGGQGRRFGYKKKPLLEIGGKTLLSYILERALPQCDAMVLNVNDVDDEFKKFDLPIVSDDMDGFQGPLAGILAGLDWSANHYPEATHVASFAGDSPFIPHCLVQDMKKAMQRENSILASACSGGRRHPVFGLWPLRIRADLRDKMVNGAMRKIDLFTAGYSLAEVDFSSTPDPFFNINTEEDHQIATRLLQI